MESTLPFLIPILLGLGLFVMVGWIAWVDARRRQMQSKSAADIHMRLLDKFATSQEFVEFLQTDEGRRFMENAAGPQAHPLERVLRSVRYGVVLVVFGLGWLALGLTDRFNDEGAITFMGFLFESVGIGFLASAAITYYFSRKWGLYTGANLPKADVFVSRSGESA